MIDAMTAIRSPRRRAGDRRRGPPPGGVGGRGDRGPPGGWPPEPIRPCGESAPVGRFPADCLPAGGFPVGCLAEGCSSEAAGRGRRRGAGVGDRDGDGVAARTGRSRPTSFDGDRGVRGGGLEPPGGGGGIRARGAAGRRGSGGSRGTGGDRNRSVTIIPSTPQQSGVTSMSSSSGLAQRSASSGLPRAVWLKKGEPQASARVAAPGPARPRCSVGSDWCHPRWSRID